jgi:hypothetical protein
MQQGVLFAWTVFQHHCAEFGDLIYHALEQAGDLLRRIPFATLATKCKCSTAVTIVHGSIRFSVNFEWRLLTLNSSHEVSIRTTGLLLRKGALISMFQ